MHGNMNVQQKPLPDSVQHSQDRAIYAPAGFKPTIPASAADLRLRLRGYWDRHSIFLRCHN